MIVGLGTDIVEIDRIEAQCAKSFRLAERVLTESEMAVFGKHLHPARYLAKRFAAKEAAVKALGTGIGHGISWQHIEVTNNDLGQPQLLFSGEFASQCERRGITNSAVSISDEKHYAVATVILETGQ
jgi:holo-[acyl-carrier protein] synthase